MQFLNYSTSNKGKPAKRRSWAHIMIICYCNSLEYAKVIECKTSSAFYDIKICVCFYSKSAFTELLNIYEYECYGDLIFSIVKNIVI